MKETTVSHSGDEQLNKSLLQDSRNDKMYSYHCKNENRVSPLVKCIIMEEQSLLAVDSIQYTKLESEIVEKQLHFLQTDNFPAVNKKSNGDYLAKNA